MKKAKINVPEKSLIINLVGLAIFITIISIMFIITIGSLPSENNGVAKSTDYFQVRRVMEWSQFMTDIVIAIVFMILMLIGRTRMEYGSIYGWLWLTIFLLVSIIPFIITPENLLRNILIIFPILIIYAGQFIFLNELSWERKKEVESKRRRKWL